MYVHVHVKSLSKAKQLCLKTTPYFSREIMNCLRRDSNPQCSAYLGRCATDVHVHTCKLIFQVKKYTHTHTQHYWPVLRKWVVQNTSNVHMDCVWLLGPDLDDLQEQVGPGLSGPLLKLLLRGGWREGGAEEVHCGMEKEVPLYEYIWCASHAQYVTMHKLTC